MLLNMTIINNPTNCAGLANPSRCLALSNYSSFLEHQRLQLFSQGRVLMPAQVWGDGYIHAVFIRAYDTDFTGHQMLWDIQKVVWTDSPWGSKTPAGLKANLLLFSNIRQLKEFVPEQCSAPYWPPHFGSVPRVFLKPHLLYYQSTL